MFCDKFLLVSILQSIVMTHAAATQCLSFKAKYGTKEPMDLTVKKQVTNAHNLTTTATSNWQAPPDQLIGLYYSSNTFCNR